ncbi:unnamed protein product [Polarella glacialis]|uniref:Uncharacterized protein n=1 Tax=Polarella glacialis TaxID=89957 RepID=A0A813DBV7_POLGL|nr:unnamed protein product [Polarella glacialis]
MLEEPGTRHFLTPAALGCSRGPGALPRWSPPARGSSPGAALRPASLQLSVATPPVGAHERELGLRLRMREKSWGSRESSWLVKNAFAGWRSLLRCGGSAKVVTHCVASATSELTADRHVIEDLQRALVTKEAQLAELSQRLEAFLSRGSEVRLLLQWSFASFQHMTCQSRFERQLQKLEEQGAAALVGAAAPQLRRRKRLGEAEERAASSGRELEDELNRNQRGRDELELRLGASGDRYELLEERLRQAELRARQAEALLHSSEQRAEELEMLLGSRPPSRRREALSTASRLAEAAQLSELAAARLCLRPPSLAGA